MGRRNPVLRDGGVEIGLAFEETRPELAECLRKAGKRHVELLGAMGDDEGGCRVDLDLKNTSARPVDLTLDIHWEHETLASVLAELYARPPGAESWRPVTVRQVGEHSRLLLRLHPGVTALAICPRYAYADLQTYLEGLAREPGVEIDSLCPSARGRDIPLVKVSRPGNPGRRENVLIVCRAHAYESAGSLIAEGMLDMLVRGDPPADLFLDDFDFHVIPMHNVDGVVEGFQRYTRPNGADLNRDIDANRKLRPEGADTDRELVSHIHLIDHLAPAAYLNIHNWTGKFRDGLFGYDQEELDLFERFMPACVDHQKIWDKRMTVIPGNRSPGRYARETHGTLSYVLEFPWYLRTFDAMRDAGRRALQALMHSLYHKRALDRDRTLAERRT